MSDPDFEANCHLITEKQSVLQYGNNAYFVKQDFHDKVFGSAKESEWLSLNKAEYLKKIQAIEISGIVEISQLATKSDGICYLVNNCDKIDFAWPKHQLLVPLEKAVMALQIHKEELLSTTAIIESYLKDEEANYKDNGSPENHIWESIIKLKELLWEI